MGTSEDTRIEFYQLTVSDGRCTDMYATCDMEREGRNKNGCRLKQDKRDDFDWTRWIRMTPSGLASKRFLNGREYPVTGPVAAKCGIYYMYAEASSRRKQQVARLRLFSNVFPHGDATLCLRFAYNLNGFHVGRLRVYKGHSYYYLYRVYLWSVARDHGVGWHTAALQITISVWYHIGFEAEMKGGYSGDIALDDVSITRGKCHEVYLLRCDFETYDAASTMCGMQQDRRDDFDWTLWSGPTPSQQTGPSTAYSGAYYMYIEASSPRRKEDKARFLLPSLGHEGKLCLKFRYHMYGFHTGRLGVYVKWSTIDLYPAWSLSGEQGNKWLTQRLTLTVRKKDQIGFLGVRGGGYSGDIAIDNIVVKADAC
ncbi:MAM and LDL-receptor class A domain-containing protein 1 [Lamellibrachia satsuma]|nr:MAM and LDL-receptor class A domain-containing protein 1 [Lamellibrachia satsuma]